MIMVMHKFSLNLSQIKWNPVPQNQRGDMIAMRWVHGGVVYVVILACGGRGYEYYDAL